MSSIQLNTNHLSLGKTEVPLPPINTAENPGAMKAERKSKFTFAYYITISIELSVIPTNVLQYSI
jgi:hypothetical protein